MTASAMPPTVTPRPLRRPEGPEPLRRRQLPKAPAPAWRRRVLNYLLLFVIAVLLADGLVGESGLMQQLRTREAHEEQVRALEALRQKNQALRNEIRSLRDDPGALESLAREELGLIRPGEYLFIVRDAIPASR
jgi:cell division protein FtsB